MAEETQGLQEPPSRAQNIFALVLVCGFLVAVVLGGWYLRTHRDGASSEAVMGKEVRASAEPVKVGEFTAHFKGEFRMPRSEVQMEFRNSQNQLVDVGRVKLVLDMNMPGMVMHDAAVVNGRGGRYTANVKPQMVGGWTAKLSYSGPQGSGEKTFPIAVK